MIDRNSNSSGRNDGLDLDFAPFAVSACMLVINSLSRSRLVLLLALEENSYCRMCIKASYLEFNLDICRNYTFESRSECKLVSQFLFRCSFSNLVIDVWIFIQFSFW